MEAEVCISHTCVAVDPEQHAVHRVRHAGHVIMRMVMPVPVAMVVHAVRAVLAATVEHRLRADGGGALALGAAQQLLRHPLAVERRQCLAG